MLSQTTQNRLFQKAARSVLTAKRQDQGYTATITVAPDMPLEFRSLGKDLVAQLTGAVAAEKGVDGRYVDLVAPSGERIKVYSRVIRKRSTGYLANITSIELSSINYSKLEDRPDSLYLVTYNPLKRKVDVFRFVAENAETRSFASSYSVRYSQKTDSFNSKEPFREASFTI